MNDGKLKELANQIEEIKESIFLCSEWLDEMVSKVERLMDEARRI